MILYDRDRLLNVWTTVLVFASLYFLGAGFIKSVLIGGFFMVSCTLNYGRRWLIDLAFIVTLVAIAVAIGFPHPSQWWNFLRSILVSAGLS